MILKKSDEKDELKKELASVRREFETMRSNLVKITKSLNELVMGYNKTVSSQDALLKDIKSTNENVEDTLLNVLAAIRQNEYLQAWYPAQKGYPEMKVTGTHPMNLERKTAKKS